MIAVNITPPTFPSLLRIVSRFPAEDGWAWRRHPSESAFSLMTDTGREAVRVCEEHPGNWRVRVPDSDDCTSILRATVDGYATSAEAMRQAEHVYRPCSVEGCSAGREWGSCRCGQHSAWLDSIRLNFPLFTDAVPELRQSLAVLAETALAMGVKCPTRCQDPHTRRYAWLTVALAIGHVLLDLGEGSNSAETDPGSADAGERMVNAAIEQECEGMDHESPA